MLFGLRGQARFDFLLSQEEGLALHRELVALVEMTR